MLAPKALKCLSWGLTSNNSTRKLNFNRPFSKMATARGRLEIGGMPLLAIATKMSKIITSWNSKVKGYEMYWKIRKKGNGDKYSI